MSTFTEEFDEIKKIQQNLDEKKLLFQERLSKKIATIENDNHSVREGANYVIETKLSKRRILMSSPLGSFYYGSINCQFVCPILSILNHRFDLSVLDKQEFYEFINLFLSGKLTDKKEFENTLKSII